MSGPFVRCQWSVVSGPWLGVHGSTDEQRTTDHGQLTTDN